MKIIYSSNSNLFDRIRVLSLIPSKELTPDIYFRTHLEDRESAEQRSEESEKRFQKLRLSLASSLSIDLSVTSDASLELALSKVKY